MSKITIEDLYDRCDVLVSLGSHQSHFIQMYDPPVLETDNDGGLITYQFLSNDELVEVTDDGYILIDGYTYIPYVYQQVSKEFLTDVSN